VGSLIPQSSVLHVKAANVNNFGVANYAYSSSVLILNFPSEIRLVNRLMTDYAVSNNFILSPSLNVLRLHFSVWTLRGQLIHRLLALWTCVLDIRHPFQDAINTVSVRAAVELGLLGLYDRLETDSARFLLLNLGHLLF